MGIAVHRSNIVSDNRLLVAEDSNNSRMVTIKFMPLNIGFFGGPGQVDGKFMNPKDVKVHYSSGASGPQYYFFPLFINQT
jgi:hypothetical protein